MKEKVLVTGAAGFIGSHLVEALLEKGYEVICIDSMNEYYDVSLKRARLARFSGKVAFHQFDIVDVAGLNALMEEVRPTAICHLAAQAGVRYSLENPYIYGQSNLVGTLNVLEAARRYGAKRVILASSSSVYGENPKVPFAEEDAVDHPISLYAATKRAAELLAYSYHRLYGLDIACLRFFTVYGPFSRPDMALLKFAQRISSGAPIDVYNNGDMKRDFTYISDIVDGFIAALERSTGYEIYNLGNGSPVALLDFIELLEKELGKKAERVMLPMQAGDVPITYADTRKAERLLGFKARVSLEEGVRRFVEWYRSYYAA